MDIDWVIAIGVFLIFLAWSFSYYLDLVSFGVDLDPAADLDKEKLTDFLSVDVYRIPVKFYSEEAPGSVLKAKNFWYSGEKNSTRVLGDTYLNCEVSGDDLYWQADLVQGNNYFFIEFADLNTTRNCSASLSTGDFNLTIPWVAEREKLVSLSKINNMTNTSYTDFKGSLGIGEDFLIWLNTTTWNTSYGKNLPGNTDVYVRVSKGYVWEVPEKINITVFVW